MAGLVLLVALASPCAAQYLEKVIPLPDSLGGALWPNRVAYDSARGKLYVSGADGKAVVAVDLVTREKVARVVVNHDRSSGGVSEMCLNPMTGRLYVAHDWYDTVRVVDCAVDSVVRSIQVPSSARVMACNPARNRLYCGGFTGTLTIVDVCADTVVASLPVSFRPKLLFLSESSDKLYCACTDGSLWVIDCRTDRVLAVLSLPGTPIAGCFNPVYNKVYISVPSEGITIIDCDADSIITVLDEVEESWALCCNPSDGTVYCTDADCDSVFAIDGRADCITAGGATDWYPVGVACNPAMNVLYVTCDQGSQGAWADKPVIDVMDCTLLVPFAHIIMPDSSPIACLPAHDLLVAFHKDYNAVSFIDTRVNEVVDTCYVASYPRVGCHNPVSNKAYFLDQDSDFAMVLDCSLGKVTRLVTVARRSRQLCHDPVVNKVYITETGTHTFPCSTVVVLDGETDSVLARLFVGAWPRYICSNPSRGKVYCRVEDGLAVIDAVANSVLRQVPLPADIGPGCILYNPATDRLYCFGCDNSGTYWMRVVDSRTDSVVLAPWVPTVSTEVLLNSRHNKLYIVAGSRPYVYDCSRDTVTGRVHAEGTFAASCYNPKDDKVYLATIGPPMVAIVDGATDSTLTVVGGLGGPGKMCYDSLHNLIYVTEFAAARVALISGTSDSIARFVDVGRGPMSLVWNTRDSRVYVTCKFNSALFAIRDSAGIGVAESPSSSGTPGTCRALVNGSLELTGRERATLFDITGRHVRQLTPGSNDVQGLPPGVYFVQRTGYCRSERVAILKW